MFWWLTIGFAVVWIIAVAIEIIWFWGPPEELEAIPAEENSGRAHEAPASEETGSLTTSGEYAARVTNAGG